jgi:hypothetical protein
VIDRASLTAAASLNKLVVADAPYTGRSGADLLSRDAIAALAPGLDPARLSDELGQRPALAAGVAAEVGRRLAALVATLRRGPHDPPVADRTPERVAALEEWTTIDDVVLGGGLLAGAIGPAVVDATRAHLDARRAPPTRLDLASNPAHLGLIGAARMAGPEDGEHLVLDAGQSWIKRGVAEVGAGAVRRIHLLPPVRFDRDGDVIALLGEAIGGWPRPSGPIPCSVASYVRDGLPIRDRVSPYDELADVPAGVRRTFTFVHDGTAAWRGTGRTTSSAVIVLGTWLAVGMGPHEPPPRLLSIDAGVEVHAENGHQ